MIDPNKVVNFLDVTGNWDPSLMFVMGGGVLTTAIAYRFIFAQDKTLFENVFHLPDLLSIDIRLLFGYLLFHTLFSVNK